MPGIPVSEPVNKNLANIHQKGMDFAAALGSLTRGGVQNAHKSLGRNDPCHCGSGKKYKRCHFPN